MSEEVKPAELLARSRQLQAAARATSTRRSCDHWWWVFTEFCVEVGWAQAAGEVPLPVPARVMELWVVWLSRKYAESTISISLAAISAVHAGYSLQSPTGGALIRSLLEGVAWTGAVRGVAEAVTVTPDHLRAFVQLTVAWTEAGQEWSPLRLKRAVAMVVIGFMAYLRKSEVGELDVCDVTREADCTKVRVCKAKNDPVGRGRVTIVGAACGDSREMEQTLWTWMDAAELTRSARCSKSADPRRRCMACGPLFPRLGGAVVKASSTPMGKSALTEELRGLYRACKRVGSVPQDLEVRRYSAIALRRGGNSAAAAAGVSGILRASHGRWRSEVTPDQSYTFIHKAEMIGLATTMLKPRL